MSALARLHPDEFHRRVAAGERPDGTLHVVMKAAPTLSPDPQVVSFCLTSNSEDSYGDTVEPKGVQFDKSGAGTIALFGHDPSQIDNVIGRVHNIRLSGNRLLGDVHFAPAETNPKAETVRRLVTGGYLNSVSIGFQPLEWTRSTDPKRPGGIDFKKIKLLEVSVVPMPANADAIALARSAGIRVDLVQKELQEMPKTTAPERRAAAVAMKAANDNAQKFGSLGEMLKSAFLFDRDGIEDNRLVRAPTAASEGDPAGGGFLVPTTNASQMLSTMYEESVIAQLCTRWPTDKPLAEVSVPGIDETSRADGSRMGGITSRWLGEGDSNTPVLSFPRFRNLTFTPRKLLGALVATDELMADGALFDTYVRRAFAAEFGFKLDSAIFNGSGAGTPAGILSSTALVTVAKESGQAGGTIVKENIDKMWSRLPAASRRRAVWLVCESAEPTLSGLNAATTGQGLVYGSTTDGTPTIKGRPVLPIEQGLGIGTPGDILLVDLSHYILLDGGTTPALSLHFKFDSDQNIFRFVMRIDGKTEFATPVTSVDGTTRSPFVALAQR